MQETMSLQQLGAASLEMLFHFVQLKSGDGEIKCQCLVFKVFLKVNSFCLVGLSPLNRKAPHLSLLLKLLFNLIYECAFPIIIFNF